MTSGMQMLGSIMAMVLLAGGGQTGTVYRYVSDKGGGTVWVVGDEARLERDPALEGTPGYQVSLWKGAGKQLLLLNTKDHTYYDSVAYHAGKNAYSTVDTLNVKAPFIVADVSDIRVDLVPPSRPEASSSTSTGDCRRVALTLSYKLELRLKVVPDSIPGRVSGTAEFCLVDSLPIARLPFDHGLEIVSGIRKVDVVIAERLASLKGVPIRRTLTVKRQLERGEEVSKTSTLALSEFRVTEIPPDRFEVPRDYRYQEPVLVGPVRQTP